MDWQRTGLIAGILIVLYLLLLEWNQYQEIHQPIEETAVADVTRSELPELESAIVNQPGEDVDIPVATDSEPVVEQSVRQAGLITVTTDVLSVTIDTYGGDIVRAGLLQHLTSLDESGSPFVLLNRTNTQTYVAQSGLIGRNGTDTAQGRPVFSSTANSYQLQEGQNQLVVDLVTVEQGVEITKQFVFTRGDYLVDLNYQVNNRTAEDWSGALFGQIKRDSHKPSGGSSVMGAQPYLGAALTTSEKNFEKIDFDDLAEGAVKEVITGGWIAMVQHYFISAWIPDQKASNTFTLKKRPTDDIYTFGFTSPALTIAAGQKGELSAGFYVGPKDQYRLEAISPYLDLTVDYGWLWWIAKPIFYVLDFIHGWVGNWGWAIILLTVMIKGLFFHLSATSYRSMANMRKLQPEMQRMRELYGDDRQKLSQETMNLYRKEKVNPMGGCLPILVQMPVFIALYWVLLESVELRHAPWILWIQDMSAKDPFFILPLLMGVSMFIQTRLNPAPPDPMQARVMQIMPIAFTFFFMFFPAGLVLYWTVNNVLSIIQQWIITRRIEAAG